MRGARGLPSVTVELGGTPLPATDLRSLGVLRVQQRLSLPSLCELAFVDPRGVLASSGVAPGTSLRVSTSAQPEPLFTGEVTAVEYAHVAGAPREVRVRGYDVLHRLRKRQPVRAHVQVTLQEVARELVADLGLSVEADASGPLWRQLVQHGQSDLDFLAELADRCGVYLGLRDGALRLMTLEGEGEPLPLLLGESLLEATVEVNGDPACRSVSADGWDPLRARHHSARASQARQGRKVDVEAPPSLLGSPGERALVNELAEGDAHAEAAAQAELDHRSAREVVLTAVAEGDARLRPGARVEVRGITPAVSGRYVLTAVTHVLDVQRGFVSELSSAPPQCRARTQASAATLGVVSRVDDPEGLGRVRATLPTYGGVETEWMQVLSLGAGSGRGLVMLPDVGDQILLVLADGDPARGVVLGGLFGEHAPTDTGVEGGSVRRYSARTAGGHKLVFDDEGKTLRLEDGTGSYVELTPSGVRLHSKVPLDIEAPGQPVVIRGQTIDFRRG